MKVVSSYMVGIFGKSRSSAFFGVLSIFACSLVYYVFTHRNNYQIQSYRLVEFREIPLQSTINKIDNLPSLAKNNVQDLLSIGSLRFIDKRLPVPLVYHGVRLWGDKAVFYLQDANEKELEWVKQGRLIDIMINDRYFQIYSAYSLRHLLQKSEFGVRVASNADFSEAGSRASSHVGKFHDTLSKIGTNVNQTLTLSDGSTIPFSEALRDEMARIRYDVETEWLVQALCSYSRITSWKNRFDETISLDTLLVKLAERPLGEGSCFGIHALQAIAHGLNLNDQTSFLRDDTVITLENYLKRCSKLLEESQQKDGSWYFAWWDTAAAQSIHQPNPNFSDKSVANLDVVGHHLEWMIVSPERCRPRSHTICNAIVFLTKELPNARKAVQSDWHNYLPVSHAVRCVKLLYER